RRSITYRGDTAYVDRGFGYTASDSGHDRRGSDGCSVGQLYASPASCAASTHRCFVARDGEVHASAGAFDLGRGAAELMADYFRLRLSKRVWRFRAAAL